MARRAGWRDESIETDEIAPGRFGVVYADPNWEFGNFGAKRHGSPRTHYKLDSTTNIARIPVARYTKPDALLILCATWPKLESAFTVARGWGFGEYVTGWPWIKTVPSSGTIRTGIGFWVQSTSELLLVFRRGKPPSPDGNATKERKPVRGLLCGSEGQFYAPVKGHSEKPVMLYDWARAKLSGPYLELFARNSIHGWTCAGWDTGYHLGPSGIVSLRHAIARGWVSRQDLSRQARKFAGPQT